MSLVKIQLTKDAGPFKKDQVIRVDEKSAESMVDKRKVAKRVDDEKPASDA